MSYTYAQKCWIWLTTVDGMSSKRFVKLLAQAENPEYVWENPEEFRDALDGETFAALMKAHTQRYFDKLFEMLEQQQITVLTRADDSYPDSLNSIQDAPMTLYVKGNADLCLTKPFAIVGTRACTYDGQKAARDIGAGLAEQGVTIVSGLALGVDCIAQRACVDAGGKTVAVLGNGLKTVYPAENERLAARIIETGGALVSEMRPWDSASKWSFPQRNRIIAGLSDGVLVVEAGSRSGALITANFALEQGKEVFAVPGSPYAAQSEGTNHLIQDGAFPCLSYWDIIESMHWGARPSKKQSEVKPPKLDGNELELYNVLKIESKSFEELINITNLSVQELNQLLTMLEIRGIIVKLAGNLYRLA